MVEIHWWQVIACFLIGIGHFIIGSLAWLFKQTSLLEPSGKRLYRIAMTLQVVAFVIAIFLVCLSVWAAFHIT